ncbi:MAG TPA: WD40 repeat domain-containing protein [Pyrinomonadaceae bacterium]|nr:WD40 repeat domain-containing protein [Pyrinomonadaceae bacterium]
MNNRSQPRCPYQGLIPYDEGDAHFFFGREQETQIIIANLFASSLTLLYGSSGVGKSSILRAGVTHNLSQRQDLLVVVFRTWQSNPLNNLKAAVANAAAAKPGAILEDVAQHSPSSSSESPKDAPTLSDYLARWSSRLECSLLIILDQFEDYFLYHAQDDAFVTEFSQAVSRSKAPISFLISIREDSLAKLDRFEKGIPGLFDNYLRLEHLDRQAAQAAIIEPLKHYNELLGSNGVKKVEIEEELVTQVLKQVKTGKVQLGEASLGSKDLSDGDARIETPFLQMVMTRLWNEEMRQGSNLLRVQTLQQLGNADRIIRTHLDDAMSNLTSDEQKIAADVFHHLVTPSRSKIAHSARDLFHYTGLPQSQIVPVLNKLSGQSRILQPVAPLSDPKAPPHYEIYHDVLAPAILDWRARFMLVQDWTRHKEDMELEQRRVSYWRLRLIALAVLILALIVSVSIILTGKTRERKALSRELAAVASKNLSTDPELSVVLALQAVEMEPTEEGIRSLRESLGEYPLLGVMKRNFLVRFASFSPNGRFLLTGGGEQTAHLWDATTGAYLKSFVGQRGQLFAATFSPDGRLIATGTNFNTSTVRIWDANSETKLADLNGHTADIMQVDFSPDSRFVVTASKDQTARLWEARTGQPIGGPLVHPKTVNRATFIPDGTRIATACEDGYVYVWETNGGGLKQKIKVDEEGGEYANANDASFSPDGRSIVAGTRNGLARLYDAETGQHRISFKHEGPVYRVSFSPDGRHILTLDRYNSIYVWDVTSSENPKAKITTYLTGDVNFPVFSPDGQLIACGAGSDAGVWDLTGKEIARFIGNEKFVHQTFFSRDGYRLATASGDGTARIWRVRKPHVFNFDYASVSFSADGRFITDSKQVWDFATGQRFGNALPYNAGSFSFSPDGKYILVINNDENNKQYSAQLQDTRNWSWLTPMFVNASIDTAVFSMDGKLLMALSNDHSVRICDVNTGGTVTEFTNASISRGGMFSPDGRYFVTGGTKGNALIWDRENGPKLVKELVGHSLPIVSVAYSLDGKFIAGEDENRSVMVWDLQTGQRKAELQGHFAGFSPDGQLILTIRDGNAYVSDWASSESVPAVILESPSGSIVDATFSPDGMFIVTTTAQGFANTFPRESFVTVGELKKMAKARVQRTLTCQERKKYLHDLTCLF